MTTPLGAAGVAAGWTPLNLPALAFWLKADAGTGAVNAGDPVTTWTDQSGNGVNPTEATNKPTYQTAVLNGLPVVRFARASLQKLSVAFTAMNGLAGRSLFVVFRQAATGVNQNLIGVDGTTVAAINIQPWGDSNLYDTLGGTANSGKFGFVSTSFVLLESIFDGSQTGNANRLKMYLNAVQQALTIVGTIPAATPTCTKLSIGTAQVDVSPFGGDIAEIIATGAAVSSSDRAACESYLNSKWAIY